MAGSVTYREITAADSAAVVDLANRVHGDNYLNDASLQRLLMVAALATLSSIGWPNATVRCSVFA